jgi:hypothetical protein
MHLGFRGIRLAAFIVAFSGSWAIVPASSAHANGAIYALADSLTAVLKADSPDGGVPSAGLQYSPPPPAQCATDAGVPSLALDAAGMDKVLLPQGSPMAATQAKVSTPLRQNGKGPQLGVVSGNTPTGGTFLGAGVVTPWGRKNSMPGNAVAMFGQLQGRNGQYTNAVGFVAVEQGRTQKILEKGDPFAGKLTLNLKIAGGAQATIDPNTPRGIAPKKSGRVAMELHYDRAGLHLNSNLGTVYSSLGGGTPGQKRSVPPRPAYSYAEAFMNYGIARNLKLLADTRIIIADANSRVEGRTGLGMKKGSGTVGVSKDLPGLNDGVAETWPAIVRAQMNGYLNLPHVQLYMNVFVPLKEPDKGTAVNLGVNGRF